MPRSFPNVRLVLVCFAALASALPIVIIGIAKLLLCLCAIAVVIDGWRRRDHTAEHLPGSTSPLILLALIAIAASLLWSTGSKDESLLSFVKHGKLILIPVLLLLITSRREAKIALTFFVGGQVFLLTSTWLLFMGVPIPWVVSKEAGICEICSYAVFSSYLDQSIMTAVLAAVAWHFRAYASPPNKRMLALIVSFLGLACVFFIFQGRTGHLVAVALITLAIFWELPKRFRAAAVAIPFVLLFVLASSSSMVHDRLFKIGKDIAAFDRSGDISSSSGDRLNRWHRSQQSIAENLWLGTGAGSWNQEINQQEARHTKESIVKITGNSHQEFLLWGVELGLPGVALLCAVLLGLYRDTRRMETPIRRAAQSVLAALVLACLFNCALYDALIGDFFCISIALLLALGAHPRPVGHTA